MSVRETAISYLLEGHALLRAHGLYGSQSDVHFFALDRALSNFEKAGGFHGAARAAAAMQALYEANRLITARSSIDGRRIILGDWFMSLAVGLALPLRSPNLTALISEELQRIGIDANRPFFRASRREFCSVIDRYTNAIRLADMAPAKQRQTISESQNNPAALKRAVPANKLLSALDGGYYKTAASETRAALARMEAWFTAKYASETANEMDSWIYGAIMSGGKRMRPILVRLCAGLGTDNSNSRPEPNELTLLNIMSTIELMHSASLVHDDIVDRSPMRRSRATINAEKGDGYAAMCGFKMIADALEWRENDFTEKITEIVAGIPMQMCEGELDQLDIENKPEKQSENEYFRRIGRKTAALIEGSCVCGAIAGGADPQTTSIVADFGRSLGLLFQLNDDLLDYDCLSAQAADPLGAASGKPVSQDMERGVYSLPLLYAKDELAKSNPSEAAKLDAVLRKYIKKSSDFRYLNRIAESAGGITYTRGKIAEYAKKALAALARLPQGSYTEALTLLVYALLDTETEKRLSQHQTKIVRLADDK